MTKAELVAKVAKKCKTTQVLSSKILNTILDEVRLSLGRGSSIAFTGFGSFSTVKRKARKGRNPQTGEPLKIPGTRAARFRPGKKLRETVGGKK